MTPKMNTFMRFAVDLKYITGDVISGRNANTIEGYVLKLLAQIVSKVFQKYQFVTMKSATQWRQRDLRLTGSN